MDSSMKTKLSLDLKNTKGNLTFKFSDFTYFKLFFCIPNRYSHFLSPFCFIAFTPESGKLEKHFLIAQNMAAHYKKVINAKRKYSHLYLFIRL